MNKSTKESLDASPVLTLAGASLVIRFADGIEIQDVRTFVETCGVAVKYGQIYKTEYEDELTGGLAIYRFDEDYDECFPFLPPRTYYRVDWLDDTGHSMCCDLSEGKFIRYITSVEWSFLNDLVNLCKIEVSGGQTF